MPMTTKINMLGIDLAKGSFHVCAVGPERTVLYNRGLSRRRLATLLAEQPSCMVAPGAKPLADRVGHPLTQRGSPSAVSPRAS